MHIACCMLKAIKCTLIVDNCMSWYVLPTWQVSYGATSIEDNTETVSTFYRTLPSDRVENYGRLVLLVKHEWFRIGILTSVKDTHYLKVIIIIVNDN